MKIMIEGERNNKVIVHIDGKIISENNLQRALMLISDIQVAQQKVKDYEGERDSLCEQLRRLVKK